jgi:peptidoglycan/xylan/chitin deacetylase (PgdA/CDA1 family)
MKRIFLILLVVMAGLLSARHYELPRAVLLTTGDGDGRGTVSDGVVLAIQAMGKAGTPLWLDNRQILHDPQALAQFSILIVPTTYGYHDADRRYSLSFLSDVEIENICKWVQDGGMLISDVYIGRNRYNGEDRISAEGILNSENWPLAECFGVTLQERNMKGDQVVAADESIWQGPLTPSFTDDEWTTVITAVDPAAQVLARWQQSNLPAVVVHRHGRGGAVLLNSFNSVHPASDGGYVSAAEIEAFYRYTMDAAVADSKRNIRLHPWKNGAPAAFALTINDGGTPQQYKRIIQLVQKEKIPATAFVTTSVNHEQNRALQQIPSVAMASHAESHVDFRTLDFGETMHQLQMSSTLNNASFRGFRFPFVNNSFWGMLALQQQGFLYDSSIAANHIEFYRGALFPYNIPVFRDGYYRRLSLLELSPMHHDDWFFYQDLLTNSVYSQQDSQRDAARFDAYLQSYWKRTVMPEGGMMIVSAHPMYSGLNDETMQPLINALHSARNDGAWIANLDDIADHWNALLKLTVQVIEEDDTTRLVLGADGADVPAGLSFALPAKPRRVHCSGGSDCIETAAGWMLILQHPQPGEQITLYW